MIKLLRRMGSYVTAFLTGRFNEMADPKVQLEQAITEAQDQHRVLTEQAANVIANQKSLEMRLSHAMDELEDLNRKARQAVLMADDAQKGGDALKAVDLTKAAESFAGRLVAIESEVESLKTLHMQASQASEQAKNAVSQNSVALQKKLSERQKLLSQLDQSKMQEQMNKAMDSLSATVGDDVPTFDEVRQKIETRQAKALGHAELSKDSVESTMLEVEHAALNSEASNRLNQMRAELGVGTPAPEISQASEGNAEGKTSGEPSA